MPKRFLHFEHHSDPILPQALWVRRILNTSTLAFFVIVGALSIGVAGYHFIASLSWVNAILEASMILGGMGAVAPMTSDGAKLFAAAYALFSGLIMITTTGILLAPFLHRMIHRLHALDK